MALTGVTWGGDEITEVATGAEVSILNNVAWVYNRCLGSSKVLLKQGRHPVGC